MVIIKIKTTDFLIDIFELPKHRINYQYKLNHPIFDDTRSKVSYIYISTDYKL